MRDDVIDRDAIAQENRCRRAARSFAWWGRIAGALWVFEAVALVFCVFWFWFAADGEFIGDPGRTLGVTLALFLLGARSTWLIHAAWRNAPRPNPGRTPDVQQKHRRVAVAILLSGVPWAVRRSCSRWSWEW